MTFRERYQQESTWQGKVIVMALFHITMSARGDNRWTITRTAQYFDCSIGLASENIRLANLIDKGKLRNCETRQSALRYL